MQSPWSESLTISDGERWRRELSTVFTFLLLILCIPFDLSRSGIPFAEPPALDLHNLYVFHHCQLKNMPYGPRLTGTLCGDVGGRPMYYPPILYWAFAWLRPLSFDVAVIIWRGFIVLGAAFSLVVWMELVRSRGRILGVAFLILLLPQFPLLFAAERGNNDILILLGWTGAAALFVRGRVATAGGVGAILSAAKLYPLFACAVLAAGMVRQKRLLVRYLGGFVSAALLCLVVPQTTLYYLEVLPRFAAQKPSPMPYSHGLPTHLGWSGLLLGGIIVAAWVFAGTRARELPARVTVLAGAIALSTFFSYTSYDYNLITVYPLMAVLFIRSRNEGGSWLYVSLWLLIVSVLGPRELFDGFGREKVLMEALALISSSMTVGRGRIRFGSGANA